MNSDKVCLPRKTGALIFEVLVCKFCACDLTLLWLILKSFFTNNEVNAGADPRVLGRPVHRKVEFLK